MAHTRWLWWIFSLTYYENQRELSVAGWNSASSFSLDDSGQMFCSFTITQYYRNFCEWRDEIPRTRPTGKEFRNYDSIKEGSETIHGGGGDISGTLIMVRCSDGHAIGWSCFCCCWWLFNGPLRISCGINPVCWMKLINFVWIMVDSIPSTTNHPSDVTENHDLG